MSESKQQPSSKNEGGSPGQSKMDSDPPHWVSMAKVGIPTLPAILGVILAYAVGDTFAKAQKTKAEATKAQVEADTAGHKLQKLKGHALPRVATVISSQSGRLIEKSCFLTGSIEVENKGNVPVVVSDIELSSVTVDTSMFPSGDGDRSVNVSYGSLVAGISPSYADVQKHSIETFQIRLAPTAKAFFSYAIAVPDKEKTLWGAHVSVKANTVICADSVDSIEGIACFTDAEPKILKNNFYKDFASTDLEERCKDSEG